MTSHILRNVPSAFRTPGGAAAIVKNGELAEQHVWGFANLEARIPLTSQTVFPICSISKQMVCLVLTDLLKNDKDNKLQEKIDQALRELLPSELTSNKDLTIERLAAMQSGLRDYWALTVLWGAHPGGRFSIYQDAPQALKRLGGFHFAPGTEFSYSNSNFMAIGLAIEAATGKHLADLLGDRLFKPAGMKTAALRPDTEQIPSCIGYEGSEDVGYIAYRNRIEWAGDAGIQASLEDMIAYEQYIHEAADESSNPYAINSEEPHYIDDSDAYYGNGLVHGTLADAKVVGHSGGLPGFRLRRVYSKEHRTSAIVLLNSEQDTEPVVEHIFKAILSKSAQADDEQAGSAEKVDISWAGTYFDEETNFAITVRQDKPGEIKVCYTGHDEKLKLLSATHAKSKAMEIRFADGKLSITRLKENRQLTARTLSTTKSDNHAEITERNTGSYYSNEVDSTFHCYGSGSDGLLYGSFDGYLGKGPAHVMRYLGENVWYLACHRSLDAPAPGNWTVVFHESEEGAGVIGVTVSCWLARNIKFAKAE